MKYLILLLIFPALLFAQEFQFRQEFDTIPVVIQGWDLYIPWLGGLSYSEPDFADIDNDGDLDLFMGQSNGNVSLFQNIGNVNTPNFHFTNYQQDSLHSLTIWGRSSPDFTDIDNDGDLDAFIGSGYVALINNVGNSLFPNYCSSRDTLFDTNNNIIFGTYISLVDIDTDGDVDIICGEWQGYLRLYRNIGTPDSFSFYLESNPWLGINVGNNGYADPTLIDIDNDGDLDLFIGDANGHIWFYRNDGTPQLYNYIYVANNYMGIDVGDNASPEFADIDGDGDYELFVGREANNSNLIGDVFFYENIGTPQNAQFNLVAKDYIELDLKYGFPMFQVKDLNNDGAPDILAGVGSSLDYFANTGDSANPRFVLEQEQYQGIGQATIDPCLVDIDADGDLDLLCGKGAIPGPPSIPLYLNVGTPQNPIFQLYSQTFITNPDFFVYVHPGVADIDGDGDYDLFVSDSDGNFYFYLNDGTPQWPNFTLITNHWLDHNPITWYSYAFGDLDHDGDLDLLVVNNPGNNIICYRNQGTPQVPNFVPEGTLFPDSKFSHCQFIDLADIDHDGDLDLFLGNYNGGMLFFRNITGETGVVGPAKEPVHPKRSTLSINPTPANPVSLISFTLSAPEEVNLEVYNILGKKIASLVSGKLSAGEHTVSWNATDKPSGIYLVRLQTPAESIVQKMMVIK
jgi:large repetitive protein